MPRAYAKSVVALTALSTVILAAVWGAGCGNGSEESTFPNGNGNGNGGGTQGDGGFVVPDGSLNLDGSPFNDGALDKDGNACAWKEATPKRNGVDIVFVIDNSHSMGDEIVKVRDNINNFAATIASSGLDYQVIMLSAKGTNLTDMRENVSNLKGCNLSGDMPLEVCVPAPLGVGPSASDPCGDNPSGHFYALDNFPFGIASHNGMWLLLNMYQQQYTWSDDCPGGGPVGGGWRKWARFDATKYIVMITDDDATYPTRAVPEDPALPANLTEPHEIMDWLLLNNRRAEPKGMFGSASDRKYIYNAVCGWVPPGGLATPEGACRTDYSAAEYNQATSAGEQHQKLAQLTGGIVESICRDDWSPILAKMADHVVSTLGCEYTLPTPGDGVIDPDQVLIVYTPKTGAQQKLPRVTDASKCSTVTNGWYYDNNASPTHVILCPAACQGIGSSKDGQVDLLFGCQAEPPR